MLKRFQEFLHKAEVSVAAVGFAATCFLVFAAAVARGLGKPINWSLDLSLFFFAWSVFLSADAAMRSDKLVNVDMIINLFPVRFRRIVMAGNYILIIAFLIALIVYGFILSYTTRVRAFQGMPGFSYTWVTLSLPVGSILLLRTSILKLKDIIKGMPGESAPVPPAVE